MDLELWRVAKGLVQEELAVSHPFEASWWNRNVTITGPSPHHRYVNRSLMKIHFGPLEASIVLFVDGFDGVCGCVLEKGAQYASKAFAYANPAFPAQLYDDLANLQDHYLVLRDCLIREGLCVD